MGHPCELRVTEAGRGTPIDLDAAIRRRSIVDDAEIAIGLAGVMRELYLSEKLLALIPIGAYIARLIFAIQAKGDINRLPAGKRVRDLRGSIIAIYPRRHLWLAKQGRYCWHADISRGAMYGRNGWQWFCCRLRYCGHMIVRVGPL